MSLAVVYNGLCKDKLPNSDTKGKHVVSRENLLSLVGSSLQVTDLRTLAVTELLQGLLVTEGVLSRLDDELETRVDVLGGLGGLGLLDGSHFGWMGGC